MKKYFMILVAALMVACVSSCSSSDDDYDEMSSYKSEIVGTWKLSEEWNSIEKVWQGKENPSTYVFTSDGKLIVTEGTNSYTGTYYLFKKDDSLVHITFTYNGNTETTWMLNVTSSTMEFAHLYKFVK